MRDDYKIKILSQRERKRERATEREREEREKERESARRFGAYGCSKTIDLQHIPKTYPDLYLKIGSNMYPNLYTHMSIYKYIRVYLYPCLYVCMFVCLYVCMYVSTDLPIYIYWKHPYITRCTEFVIFTLKSWKYSDIEIINIDYTHI